MQKMFAVRRVELLLVVIGTVIDTVASGVAMIADGQRGIAYNCENACGVHDGVNYGNEGCSLGNGPTSDDGVTWEGCLWDPKYCVDKFGQCGMLETEIESKCGGWSRCQGVVCHADYGGYCLARHQVLHYKKGGKFWSYRKVNSSASSFPLVFPSASQRRSAPSTISWQIHSPECSESGWSGYNGNCYRLFAGPLARAAAESGCLDNGAHLVSINTVGELMQVP